MRNAIRTYCRNLQHWSKADATSHYVFSANYVAHKEPIGYCTRGVFQVARAPVWAMIQLPLHCERKTPVTKQDRRDLIRILQTLRAQGRAQHRLP
jgi:hypothetical protein